MKKVRRFCGMLLLLVTFGASALYAQTYDKLWKQVEQARKKSLPQTVIKLSDEIYRKGEREQNVPQMLKAYICREACQEGLTPDSLYSNLKHMESWARSEKNPVNKAILHSLLAHEYARLMQKNRRALLSRTRLEVDEAPGDVREWSITQFVDKIDGHNRASLQDSDRLLDASAEKYVPFVVLESGSRFYGHDMYHLLVNRAVDAYRQLIGFRVDSLVQTRIERSYRDMMNAYRHRAGSEDALLLCSLDYWDWKRDGGISRQPYPAYRMRREENNRDEYLEALDSLIKEYGDREVCAEVYIRKAGYLHRRSPMRAAEALKTCEEGLKRYPAYRRIPELKNIRGQILQPEFTLTMSESGYPGDSVALRLHYRNVGGFTLHLYATTLSEVPWQDSDINSDTYKKYARKLSSTHFGLQPLPGEGKLPEDVPYLASDTLFKFRIPRETGVYILRVVPDGGTARSDDKFLVSTRFKVLTLDVGDNRMEVVTLDARSGRPIAGAKVSFYASQSYSKERVVAEVLTDAGGKAVLPWQNGIRSYVARKGKDTAMRPQRVYSNVSYSGTGSAERKQVTVRRTSASVSYSGTGNAERKQVTLLTDRSVYRPGQTVYVKGIAYRQNSDSARVMQGVDYELVLSDANRKELATRKVRTNEFGSFAAEFVLPEACLNGMFGIRTKESLSSVNFRVEEYKRPTFEITFTPVSEAYRLGDKVVLKGNVKAFNGMTVQDVPLAYTVTRRDSRSGYWGNADKPLLADTIRPDAKGDFAIPLTLDIPAGDAGARGSMYSYQVEAVVTDEAGETQTASYRLWASSEAYSFDVRLPLYICKEDSLFFTLGVRNQMDVPQYVKGSYELYPAASPGKAGKDAGGKTKPERPVSEGTFTAGRLQDFSAWSKLPSGSYRLKLSVRDSLGHEEDTGRYGCDRFILFSKHDKRPAAFADFFYYKENEEFDEQHPAAFLLGTSHRDAYVLMDVFCDRKRIESRVLQLNDTIVRMEYPYKEAYGKGITLLFNFVKNGEMHSHLVYLRKRQPERTLDMKWKVFRDRLRPGQEEEWKLVIKTPQGMPAAAEVLAMMYDASLDKIYKSSQLLRVRYPIYLYGAFRNASNCNNNYFSIHFPLKSWRVPVRRFDRFYSPHWGFAVVEDYLAVDEAMVTSSGGVLTKSMAAGTRARAGVLNSAANTGEAVEIKYVPPHADGDAADEDAAVESEESADAASEEELMSGGGQPLQPEAGLRTHFAETAFFYPQLRTDEQGELAFSFTMPQSLTRWNFRGYSHTKDMLTGMLEASAVTAKEFMLTPNMPRFVRAGDKTRIAGTIANLTGKPVKGTVVFTLFDPMTEKVIATQRRKFSVEAGRNSAVNFRFEVSDRYDLLGVRMVADGGTFSDGEQHLLPVLSNKEYITETLAMPVRGEETRTFSLDSLFNRNSRTATNRRLTVEFTGNPAWYAVQALPALSLPANDNAISWATAWYANSLAGFIANSQPRIKAVFDGWKAAGDTKETFLSRLEKNRDVKNILLSESPWVMEAATESERQARIATLFDINQLNNRNLSALTKLKELQGEDGSWSWYKGMSGSRCITGYITGLLVRLPLLTKNGLPGEVTSMRQKAFDYLHRQALEEYRSLRKAERNGARITHNSEAAMTYLYLMAVSGEKAPAANRDAYRYFLSKVGANLKDGTMSGKAQSAIILKAAGRTAEADEFIASLKEHLVRTDEMGAYFAFHANPYSWGMLPVPTHVEVMEALRMAGGNEALVEEMKLWLLKQKQTTAWNSPVATADAVYALLCQGSNLLENRGDVRISLDGKPVELSRGGGAIAGESGGELPALGYVKETFVQGSPELKAKTVTVEKRDAGIAWGAVYARYLSPISDVKQQGGELNVEKKLYVERISAGGTKSLQPVAEGTVLSAGDKIVARLTIRLDRAMDFVRLKDGRGACFEPIGSLSGYHWSNGFGYYAEVEDAATNFFFDHLGKGVYVLEHSYRIARGGTYETGLATIQCAYAPEYASHSAGGTVVVK